MAVNKRTRLKTNERQAQLLTLGKQIFGEHTYDGISTDEIAALAGISKGLLYHYFPSKRGFYIATISSVADDFLAATTPSQKSTPEQTIRSAIRRYLDFVNANQLIYRSLVRGGIGSDPECNTILDDLRETIAKRLLDISGTDNPSEKSLRVYGWLGMAEFVAVRWLETQNITREEAENTLFTSAYWAIFGDAPNGLAA
jgi:AcrR family transcriptional regulator